MSEASRVMTKEIDKGVTAPADPMELAQGRGIYVHIPYCASKCHYCDFNSYALGQAKTEPYVRALLREIEQSAP